MLNYRLGTVNEKLLCRILALKFLKGIIVTGFRC